MYNEVHILPWKHFQSRNSTAFWKQSERSLKAALLFLAFNFFPITIKRENLYSSNFFHAFPNPKWKQSRIMTMNDFNFHSKFEFQQLLE